MDKDTKQLYNTIVKDLRTKTIIQSTPARVSFAVSNLFKGIKETYHRNIDALKEKATNIANKTADLGNTINAGYNTLIQSNEEKRDFINQQAGKDVVQEAINAEVEQKYANEIERKEEILASIERDNRLITAGVGFIVDVYQSDVEHLKNKAIKSTQKPHRLLISKLFLTSFKNYVAITKTRLAERATIKKGIAREVASFDQLAAEIREQQKDNPNTAMQLIEEEKNKLSATAKDYVTLRNGLGYGVTEKEIWNAYFADIDSNEINNDQVMQPVENVEAAPVVEAPVENIQTTPVVETPVESVQAAPILNIPTVEESVIEKVEATPAVENHDNPEMALNNIDEMRQGYREELNDGYEYTNEEKKEWEDARLAEDLSSKGTTLSYQEQEANVLIYEQGLRKQREAIMEMEKQIAIIREAEQKIVQLTKNIDPNILKRVQGGEIEQNKGQTR
ncbi:MAG: hypothetical protein PHO63_02395 [Bacilli bacterium]|nr:hypothetical protein [Bacilli bacterium]MDD4809476.1 hypothetical protein [Bacilli bacterium]